eukprot:gene23702-biopygen22330
MNPRSRAPPEESKCALPWGNRAVARTWRGLQATIWHEWRGRGAGMARAFPVPPGPDATRARSEVLLPVGSGGGGALLPLRSLLCSALPCSALERGRSWRRQWDTNTPEFG